MDHDQLFKELLTHFLPDFVRLFYPDVAERLDWSTRTFLSNEVFTDFPEGQRRSVDLVARVHTLEGEPELLLLHVEVESGRRTGFGLRMFQYYTQLRWRHQLPVLPIALFLAPGRRSGEGIQEAEYQEALFGRPVVSFRYRTVSLPDLDGEVYREAAPPLAPALASLMRVEPSRRVRHKVECLRRIIRQPLDEARRWMLANVVETYLTLADTETQEFTQMLETPEFAEEREQLVTWEQRLLRQGEEKGRLEGLTEGEWRGEIKMAVRVANRRFGDEPAIIARLQQVSSEAELDQLFERVLQCESAEEFLAE